MSHTGVAIGVSGQELIFATDFMGVKSGQQMPRNFSNQRCLALDSCQMQHVMSIVCPPQHEIHPLCADLILSVAQHVHDAQSKMFCAGDSRRLLQLQQSLRLLPGL